MPKVGVLPGDGSFWSTVDLRIIGQSPLVSILAPNTLHLRGGSLRSANLEFLISLHSAGLLVPDHPWNLKEPWNGKAPNSFVARHGHQEPLGDGIELRLPSERLALMAAAHGMSGMALLRWNF